MTKKQKKSLARILGCALGLVVLGAVPLPPPLRVAGYVACYLLIGHDILLRAFRGICNRQVFDENFLMAVATLGAFLLAFSGRGEYTEAVAVMLFYQIGELFESVAVGKSRRSISALMDIRPDTAYVETPEGPVQTDPDEVPVGTVILVSPGERIPIDGEVLEGESSLDTSALTGESVPRPVRPGESVASGCINQESVLRIRTTREFGDSTASRILDLVENASSRKSRSENFITRFARIYTPAVCAGALALALLPPLALALSGRSVDFMDWLYRALTFLVISCPCALVISIPLTFFAGLGAASRQGILIKGSNFLEALSAVRTVVFDKTGTLTRGNFAVHAVHPVNMSRETLLDLASHCECASTHPIARSLVSAAGQEPDRSRVHEITETAGHGVSALVDGKPVSCGNARMLEEQHLTPQPCSVGGTIVHVTAEGSYSGCIHIYDEVKPTSREAVRSLRDCGVHRIVMLTGDAPGPAGEAARTLSITEFHAGLLPDEKLSILESILKEKEPREQVAFVGDGINDAPVISRADVGIAMGALGSDAAIEAADVVLMDDNPLRLPQAIRIARRCMRIVTENIWLAIGIKLVCLLLSALGIASMWLAIFADVGVMVLAVLNAIRALFEKGTLSKSAS